jgi:hypothetical protein
MQGVIKVVGCNRLQCRDGWDDRGKRLKQQMRLSCLHSKPRYTLLSGSNPHRVEHGLAGLLPEEISVFTVQFPVLFWLVWSEGLAAICVLQ